MSSVRYCRVRRMLGIRRTFCLGEESMRIGFFADIHANREAMEACLSHAQHQCIDRYVFLGDLIGYGADPGWVLDTVMRFHESGAVVVLGNHDEAIVREPDKRMHDDARYAIEWTLSHIDAAQANFLAGLPLTAEISDCLYVHASAWNPQRWEYITTSLQAKQSFAATPCRYTFCGHMHESALYHQSATGRIEVFKPVADIGIPLSTHRRWLVVLGSVGQPRDGNPAACYAIYDSARNVLTVFRVPFDAVSAARKIREAGLPEWLGARLERGV